MFLNYKSSLFSIVIVLTVLFSAIQATPAYADDSTPPVDVLAETQPEESPLQDSVEEEASPQLALETDSVTEESAPADDESILEQLPENTELIVIDEEGEVLPLVTQEAADAIAVIDPMWCPAGVKPKANTGGCTAGYGSLYALINDIATGVITEPTKAGTIWIQTGADASATNIVIDGSDVDLGAWSTFALILQGGWNGVDLSTTITSPSTFTKTISVINWNAPITLNDITIDSTTGVGLNVQTTGDVVLKKVQSNNNNNEGAVIDNISGAGNVTITNSQFTNNSGSMGLSVQSKGIITLSNITANDNTGNGVILDNDSAAVAKAVTVSGTNTFNANSGSGLYIASYGTVTLNNISASNNGTFGAEILNNVGSAAAGVTLTGTNIFNDNTFNGLYIASFGLIKVNNLFANSNTQYGAYLLNSGASGTPGIILTGTNEFKYNNSLGLYISTKGAIALNSVSVNTNNNAGASINNNYAAASPVTITGTNSFNDNLNTGLVIQSAGVVTINNISANGNGTGNIFGYGVSISNESLVNFKGVTLTGTNSFNDNYNDGLNIVSSGPIILNNITANNTENGTGNGSGVNLTNTLSGTSKPMAITLNGINSMFNNGNSGLQIFSYGAVTLNNITASDNGQDLSQGYGVFIANSSSDTPQKVTLLGTNVFDNNFDSGLYISSKGAVSTNNITAISNNNGYGVFIDNASGIATSSVTMSGTNKLTDNDTDNLYIQSVGTITLNNITANGSTSGLGANISNASAVGAMNVTLTGINSFNSNGSSYGLFINSKGAITVNNVTASNNASTGAILINANSPTKAGVTANGINTFNSNVTGGTGLFVQTLGNVKINSITANSNQGYGLSIDGTLSPNTGSVTLTGTNSFYGNVYDNLRIEVYGSVTLNNVNYAVAQAGYSGAYINKLGGASAPKPVILTGTNVFSNNSYRGLDINSYGAVTTNNLTAISNGDYGVYINNSGGTPVGAVTLNGTNTFSTNSQDNLRIISSGLIKVNTISSIGSVNGNGAYLNNISGTTAGVTLTGTNYFATNNIEGLVVNTKGAITINNLTANSNAGGTGATLNNTFSGFATPKAVTLTGSNSFSYNRTDGLAIYTYGSVTTNNLTANYNGQGLANGIGVRINIVDGLNTIVANITLNGNNSFNNNYQSGVYLDAFGTIKVNNLIANANGTSTSSAGAILANASAPSTAYGVTLTGTTTTSNNGYNGLNIGTKGAVTLNNITASGNASDGLYIDNTYSSITTPKPVTLTGVNLFTYNSSGAGFSIFSHGAVTMSKVTATNNTFNGGLIQNNGSATPANVTISGYGVFSNNSSQGLTISSNGKVTMNSITANANSSHGVSINNTTGTGSVTLTGINTFNNNGGTGLAIASFGAINVTKITADQNLQSGLGLNTTGTVTLTCGSFNMNGNYGWDVTNATLVTIKGVFTAGNTLADYDTISPLVIFRACPLP